MKSLTTKRWLSLSSVCLVLAAVGAGCGSDDDDDGGGSAAATTAAPAATPTVTPEPAPTTADPAEPASGENDFAQIKIGEVNFDLQKYCGDKPFKTGVIDGFGGNAWRVEVRALIDKLVKQCPNNKGMQYFDSNLDPQKFIATLNSWSAQGVNVVVAFDDYGQAVVPAFTKATKAGMKIGTQNAIPGNAKVPDDLTAAVVPDFDKGAEEWVKFLDAANEKTAKVILIGGPPGNLFDPPALDAMKKAVEKLGADVEFAEDKPQYANWDPAKTQQVMAGVLQKHKDLNGVATTYVATTPSIVRAFQAAGVPLPAITGQSSSNEVVCNIDKYKKLNPKFQLQSLDGSGNQAALAFAKVLAAYQEIEAPELGPADAYTESNYAEYINTVTNKVPECDPDLPPGADLSHALTKEEVAAVLK